MDCYKCYLDGFWERTTTTHTNAVSGGMNGPRWSLLPPPSLRPHLVHHLLKAARCCRVYVCSMVGVVGPYNGRGRDFLIAQFHSFL